MHVLVAQLELPEEDDERIAYVIPAGVYYFYKYNGDRNDDFVQIRL